jgi:hypothetical protein
VCARGKGESCGGGRSRRGGVCAKGLQCVINAKPGDLVTGDEQGTCQGKGSIFLHKCCSLE